MRRAPFGTWPSPLSPVALAAGRVSVSGPQVSGSACWWSESRPLEGGRVAVMRAAPGTAPSEVTPAGANARSRVHEYGGGAFLGADDFVIYTSYADQALWRAAATHGGRGADGRRDADGPTRLTPEAPPGEAHRYADARLVAGGPWLVAVRERHTPAGDVFDEIVTVDTSGGAAPVVLVDGKDFVAAPRPSPDGSLVAWLAWDHPQMPWDGTELWVATVDGAGNGSPSLSGRRLVAGGPAESVGQPTWAPDGALWFVSDRHGWWQPFRAEGGGDPVRKCADEAEFHVPDWVLGQATLDFSAEGDLVCRFRREGRDHVGVLEEASGRLHVLDQPYTAIAGLQVLGDDVVVIGATPHEPPAIAAVGLRSATREARVVRRPTARAVPDAWVSVPEAMSFPTADGERAYLLFHPPVGDAFEGPPGALPPLVVVCHGGPTAAADAAFDPAVQLWTTRGVAVASVDYRGSAGHGRAFRRLLDGRWGVADAEDCVAAARHLVKAERVDGGRMVVKGSSAGGLTALRALAPGGPFAAAVVAYPVTDLRALAQDTHKFESHYLDGLVGPWPAAAGVYEDRSPALHPERIGGAVLLLQGSDDPVVPPDQASRLAEALRARGVRCDHVVFRGEGHGFRRADTLEAAARLELAFVGEVLGFETAS